ncbi:MAG: hypothetical protein ACTSPI_14290, partial [Candidatus Heimdallarchaeaceae archaeon]
MKTKYKNKKLNTVIKYLVTFFIILLCSQLNTALKFSSLNIVNAKSDKELQIERNEYFTDLAEELNDLFNSLNYTIWERFSAYLGKGKILKNVYYEIPIEGTPYTKWFYGPNPVKDLTENWIIISKVTSINGKRIFKRNGELAFNGTHIANIITIKKGDYKNKRVVDKLNFVSFNTFLSNLILSAHDRYLTGEEQFALTQNRKDFARKFEEACNNAQKNGTLELYQEAARIFNSYTSLNSINSLYTAHIVEKDNLAAFELVIGVNEKKRYPVLFGENQTTANILEIRETIKIDWQYMRFSILDSFRRLKYEDKQRKNVDDLFKILERQSHYLRGETELNSNIQTVPDDTIYNIEKNEELDPGSTGEIYGTSLGQINTKNYADYNTELLAVAVICTDESSTNIDDLLAEASDREVYAFIDRFEFSTWGSLLLDDSMDIRYYDVVFVSDQELTSSQYTWDESWELTPMQRHKLETFIFAGGSIYFSSSINNQESWLRDRYMPVTEIQARTNNRIANSNFDKGMPFIKSNTFVLDSCDETDEWYEAINGEGNTWEWDRSHGESYLSGERTGDKMRFGIPFENENSHHVAISAS